MFLIKEQIVSGNREFHLAHESQTSSGNPFLIRPAGRNGPAAIPGKLRKKFNLIRLTAALETINIGAPAISP